MNSSKIHLLYVLFLFSFQSFAQPNTEIYLFDLREENNGWKLTNPINISDNEGYDNQPSFWIDGESVLYARTVNGQTDIARYFIKSDSTVLLSATPQGSEYSPSRMSDNRISSIRLDTTGLQLLYAYDLNGRNKVLVKNLVIGYHAWISDSNIVAFVLGEPSTLQIINTITGDAKIIAENIGRSLHRIPNATDFSYVDKSSDTWTINQMNPQTLETTVLTATLENAEDYTWTPNNQIIMGDGTKLFLWEQDKKWEEIADLSQHNMSNISRLSVSPDGEKIVLVSE